MKKNIFLTLVLLVALFTTQVAVAQAPKATPEEAITGLLTRIGGQGAAALFEIVIDANLAENGKDVFIITSQNGKPCIKGNSQLSVATGINWYLNHYAHINLTWNNLTTDLSAVTLPLPTSEEKHVCNTTYRYDFNTCTFSYSMAFWTWERWQQEIDWMALHGVNAPLNLVGLDVVTRKFLQALGVSDEDINAYIAGPGFIAWFAMNNLEGWGGTIKSSSTGVYMDGNPEWWYTRQEQLCRDMLQRMRELGMQPVIPGFSGQVPNCITKYTINGFSSGDVMNNGTWAGGYTRPDILHPASTSYATLAPIYYQCLEEVMGVSEFYSMDPFHEGTSLPQGITAQNCWPNIMAKLDDYLESDTKDSYKVGTRAKWIIQKWQSLPPGGIFDEMFAQGYGERFIGLDLFADNIYANNAAFYRTNFYAGCAYIYCMLHNFGGRSGLHGRLQTTFDGYFEALGKGNNCQGIGATPEGIETNPILYDMLFELPWMDVNNHGTADAWLEKYAHSRYGIQNETALAALQNLKKSVWNCTTNQQGTSEAIILARPNWSVGSVSTWSTSAIYWDTQDVRLAADQLASIKDLVTTTDGRANYDYDFIDVVRQAMVDYAAELLPLINAARTAGNNAEYTRLYNLYLQLMLDLDEMLSYDENFKLERWTSLARNIAGEVEGTNDNDRNWLEWNARTQVTVWSKGDTDLHDYSNRCWAGLIKDFHYKRWKHFFENNGNAPSGGWYSGFEYPWTVDFNNTYDLAGDYSQVVIPNDMTATEKAAETFGNYFGRVKGADKNYIFPMGVTTNATKSDVIPEVYRGKTVELPLVIEKETTLANVWIDLNNDGAAGNGETFTQESLSVEIPADATIGRTKAKATFADGTEITFNIAIVEDITAERTVTAAAANTDHGSVAIEGTSELSITTMEAVKITATAKTGYNFRDWTDAQGNVVSNDNPFIYYGKEDASFTANFIQDKWGVVACSGTFSGDIAGYKQFIHNLTFAYYNREAETILNETTAPTEIFNTIPKIVNVPRGASFKVYYDDGDGDGLKYCYFRAFIDLNADGDFDDDGELLKSVGTDGAANTAVCANTIDVLLPYDMPVGITHMRLRFDGAWDNGNKPSARGAKDASIRPVYEMIINVTEGSDKAAHIEVKSNNEEWGTVECWTDETPGWTASNEWDVSANIPMHIKATPLSDDAEFLGWYDQYGRLFTTELEYSCLAMEDAVYTARFRKFLNIDGWELEYRTQPGSDITTKILGDGVKPETGKTYYIAAHAYQSNGSFVDHYLYDNNGTLATTTAAAGNNYLWTCTVNSNGTYSFQNASGKYLANNGSYHLSIGETAAKYAFETANKGTGVALTNVSDGYTGSKWMVTQANGSSFNKNSTSVNNGSWCNDYILTEVGFSTEIILTKVRKSGEGDLTIPASVEVFGEQCKVVGIAPDMFNNNKELTSITLPSTIEYLGSNVMCTTSLNGGIAPSTDGRGLDSNLSQVIDLGGYALENNKAWTLNVTFETEGTNSLYNQWGTILLSGGENASNNQWLYLSANDNGHLRLPGFSSLYNDTYNAQNFFYQHTAGKISTFTVSIANQGNGKAVVTVTNSEDTQLASSAVDFNPNGVTKLSSYITTGVNITKLEITEGPVPNPFIGCSNLDKIVIDGDCDAYYVDNEGDLYNSNDVLVCSPEGKEKGADRRALGELIEKMQALTAQVATYNPAGGTAQEITLQTTNANAANYLWTNNADPDEGSIDHLVDDVKGNDSNFFHSNWHSVSTPEGYHYIEVDLGEGNYYSIMQFAYHTRTGCGNDFPDKITVMGSNDKQNYTDVYSTDGKSLPQSVNKNFTSDVFDCGTPYRYLRFKVDAERTYWHMGEFELFKATSSATVFKIFENTQLTNEFAAERYDVLLSAIATYDNGTTAAEMQAAVTALQTAYDELEAKIKTVLPFTLTTDEENPVLYNINFKRSNNDFLKFLEDSKQVKLLSENTANASYYAFYFMNGANGLTIHPYNGYGKVLGATDITNGHSKITAVEPGTEGYVCEWTLVGQADGYYNIKITKGDASNYMSDFGNYGEETGFYGSNNSGDAGSLFKFIEATFDPKNPRYYQLKDVKATMPDATNIHGGTSVGLYTGGTEYREAYTAAAALETAGNTSDAAECYAAYTALREAKEAFSYNVADPEKVYVIVSTATNSYCAGKYVYSPRKPTTRSRGNYTGTHKQEHLIFDSFDAPEIEQKSLAAFQFEATGNQGEYKMKNLHTGLYVKAFAGTHMGAANTAQIVKINSIADGQVTLKIGDNSPMHAQQDYGVIVQWGASVGNASTWTIDEVTDLSQFNYTVTVPESGVATLALAFNVVLPQGVTAYDVTASNIAQKGSEYVYTLSKVATAGDVLAAGTPVIIKAAAGTYEFAITLSNDGAKGATEGSVLKGTYWQQAITPAADAHYYTLATDDEGKPVFNYCTGETTIDANTCWLQLGEKQGDVICDAADADEPMVPEGVYNINFEGEPIFVAYTEAKIEDTDEADGYHLLDAGHAENTDYVAAAVPADAIFTVTYSGEGYKLSAQGLYLKNTKVGDWAPLFLSADENEAGVYLFEETETDGVYKLKSSEAYFQYVKSWGFAFGNDAATNEDLSTFTLTPVTEYTLTVGESGVATLCLPFNVVLPQGVTAHDITASGVVENNGRKEYRLTQIAAEGDVIAAGTPVIVQAAAGDHTLTITMNNAGAKGAADGSVLEGTFVPYADAEGNNYVLNAEANFVKVPAETTVAANTCWLQLGENQGDVIYNEAFEEPEVPVTELVAGSVYRIKNVVGEATKYIVNRSVSLALADKLPTDNSALWVCLEGENGGYKFVSALGTATFGWKKASEEPQEYTIVEGTTDATFSLKNGEEYLAIDGNAFGSATEKSNATDWSFELVEDAAVGFATKIKKNYKWSTMYLPYAVNIPAGVEAYYATTGSIEQVEGSKKKVILLNKIDTYIPKKTAVLLYRVDDDPTAVLDLNFELAEDVAALEGDLLFQGNVLTKTISDDNEKVYFLLNNSGKEAFYWVTSNGGITCEANKAYFTQPKQNSSSSYSFRFDWGGTTGVEDIWGDAADDDAAIYDLQGRRVLNTVKGGIYIKNGEKFIAR